MRFLLAALLLGAVLSYTTAYRNTEKFRDEIDNEVDFVNSLDELEDINEEDLPGLNDEEDELNDPRPFRVRFRGRRIIRRIGRIRIRVDKLKCPLRCAAYYTCLAKSSGIARMFCYKLKKSCRC
uniref:WegIE-2 putative cnidarian restricted protein n=1 Tax=Clytia hemisphaerica TaxID=252671 RepID=A0A069DM53_9CNID